MKQTVYEWLKANRRERAHFIAQSLGADLDDVYEALVSLEADGLACVYCPRNNGGGEWYARERYATC